MNLVSIILETGEDAENFAAQLSKPLTQLRIAHNTVLNVEDFSADFTLEISIIDAPSSSFEDPDKPYAIVGGAEAKAAGEAAPHSAQAIPAPAPDASNMEVTSEVRGVLYMA